MNPTLLKNDEIPYFCWDRKMTVADIKRHLRSSSGFEWTRTASWILREAAFADVWTFLTPSEVGDHLSDLAPYLGRKTAFWKYIIGAWHELGKV